MLPSLYLFEPFKYFAKRKIKFRKRGYETRSGSWAPDLLYFVESYVLGIGVKVPESVKNIYTNTT